MPEREMGPEQLSEMITIDVIQHEDIEQNGKFLMKNKQQARRLFATNSILKWAFDRRTLRLKLWSAHAKPYLDHRVADSDSYSQKTYGQVDVNEGLEFREKDIFSSVEKDAIKLSLEKFLNHKIYFSTF